MSRSVDERIVDMQFNNKDFEEGISTSLKSLDSLKKGLDTTNNDGSLSGLQAAVSTIGDKFTTLGIIGVTALQNITNSAVDAGVALLKSLTLDNISAGFEKYEQKTTAVQTILNSTGKSMDEVNEQLEKLMWFTDETSYNFIDMVSNIGKFTSSGVELDTAVTAMEGIANWAALSGQGTNEASRAMYNLAQAIGIGAVKLQDWKSIENANMATKEFKEEAIKTAIALGTLDEASSTAKGTIVDFANFSSTLSEEWFTSDVLLATLDKYGEYTNEVFELATENGLLCAEAMELVSDGTESLGERAFKAAQEAKTFTDAINATKDAVSSGWLTSFEIIFGDYYEAKELWTNMANDLWEVFASGAERRNEMLQDWKDLGGRDLFIEAVWGAFEALGKVIEPIKNAWEQIFPPMTGEKLFDLTEKFHDFVESIKIGDETADKLQRTFAGLFAVLDLVKQAIGFVFNVIKEVVSVFSPAGAGVLDFTANIGDMLVNFNETVKTGEVFSKALEKVRDVIGTVVDFVKDKFQVIQESGFFEFVKDKFSMAGEKISDFATKVKEAFANFEGFDFSGIKSFFDAIFKGGEDSVGVFTRLKEIVSGAFDKIKEVFSALVLGIGEASGDIATAAKAIVDAIADILKEIIKVIGELIPVIVETLFKMIDEMLNKIVEYLPKFIDAGVQIVLALINGITDNAPTLIDATTNMIITILKTIVEKLPEIISQLVTIVGGAINQLIDSLKAQFEEGGLDGLLEGLGLGALVAIALKIKDFVDTLKEGLDFPGGFLDGIKDILDGVRGCLEAYQTNIKAKTLLTIATAVGVLAASLLVLSLIDSEKMVDALIAMTVIFAELAATMVIMKAALGSDGMAKVGTEMALMAAAILILSIALKSLAELDWDQLAIGIAGIGALAAILVVAGKSISSVSDDLTKGSIGMIAFAAAMLILVQSVKGLAEMDPDAMTQGLIGVGVLMAEIAAFTKLADPEKLTSTGIAMIAMGAAMKIFASAVADFAELDPEELAKGLISVGVILAEVAGFSKLIDPEKLISTGIAMIAIGAAMLIFAQAVGEMGQMSWEEIAKGLITMAGSLGIIVVALNLMPSNVASKAAGLLILSAALLVLGEAMKNMGGMSWGEIAASLVVLAGSLTIITIAMNAMTGTLAGAAAMVVMAAAIALLVPSLQALGEMTLAEIGASLLELAGVFAIVGVAGLVLGPLAPVILSLAAAIALLGVGVLAIGAGLTLFATGLTMLAAAGGAAAEVLTVAIIAIADLIPYILEKIGEGVVAFAGVITEGVPAIMEAVGAVFTGLIQLLDEMLPELITTVLVFIDELLLQLVEYVPKFTDSAMKIVAGFLQGIADNIQDVVDAGMELVINFLQGIADNIQDVVEVAIDVVVNFLEGIAEKIPDVAAAGVDIVVAIIEAIGKETPRLVEAGFQMIIDFINGLAEVFRTKTPELMEAVGNLAGAIIEGIVEGLIAGIGSVGESMAKVGTSILESFKNILGIHSPSKEATELGEYTDEGLVEGLENGKADVENAATTIGSAVITAISTELEKISWLISDAMSKFVSGIRSVESQVRDAGTVIGSSFISALNDGFRDIGTVADNVINGLVNGLYNGSSRVASAARSVAASALNAANSELGIASPSKAFTKVGQYAGQGLVNGLLEMTRSVSQTSGGMGSAAINSLKEAIAGIADIVDSDVDSSPTIRPVLDLSDVQNGIQKLNSLFNSSQFVTLELVTSASANIQATKMPSKSDEVTATTEKTEITNQFNISELVVREEADIDAIATKLYQKQHQAMRGKGGRSTNIA